MAKTESTLVNMVLALLIITAIAGGTLGMVYKVTKEPIAVAKLAKQKKAIEQVVPGFDNNPTEEVYELESKEGYKLKVFPCKKGEELLGVAISSKTDKGFAGEIKIMVGLKPDGTIINYSVLEHQETPGLGSKMNDWFRMDKGNQSILDKNPSNTKMVVSKDGGDIDAITAATISSRAFLDAIMVAYNTYTEQNDSSDATSGATVKKGGQS
ncbi:RnfABCDGE type electron transport complex subunit G [Plebeiibacterium sediminum]|uniref:Ion-translocating oxidoreductase complex subunit G n=1 Tax=Plebeiibacterium sediminum TaxID=2992112 RepID=A0AAE3SFC8_9BACT|nr:RnfABCDGE type electron transport complex subunit G [Plebeiobacterium sediminum]MCW3786048.1 RnfABCDGE type electron transport complex subunit G [Plebeiobacterium sediminum]